MSEQALTTEQLRFLAAAAGAAPSLHNSQPWRLRPAPDSLGMRVYTDPSRAVPLTDPDGRALHISVGAALFNLRVAALRLGRDPEVRLLPEDDDPGLAATVRLSRPAPASPPSEGTSSRRSRNAIRAAGRTQTATSPRHSSAISSPRPLTKARPCPCWRRRGSAGSWP